MHTEALDPHPLPVRRIKNGSIKSDLLLEIRNPLIGVRERVRKLAICGGIGLNGVAGRRQPRHQLLPLPFQVPDTPVQPAGLAVRRIRIETGRLFAVSIEAICASHEQDDERGREPITKFRGHTSLYDKITGLLAQHPTPKKCPEL